MARLLMRHQLDWRDPVMRSSWNGPASGRLWQSRPKINSVKYLGKVSGDDQVVTAP